MGQFDWRSRRVFLQHSGQALFSVATFGALPKEIQDQLDQDNLALVTSEGFSVLQGFTDEKSTQMTVDVPKDQIFNYELYDLVAKKSLLPSQVRRIVRDHSSWGVDQIFFEGLRLGRGYEFRIIDKKNGVLERRQVRALDLYKSEARVALVACALDHMTGKDAKWDSFFRAKPDLAFFLGDNVYGDIGLSTPGPAMLWRRYIETRRRVPFYHAKELTPVLATWDDHDYGLNDVNHSYRHKEDSLATFNAFFAQNIGSARYSPAGLGVASHLQAFGHDFIFLDNRYFRDLDVLGAKSFWGPNQTEWLNQNLVRSNSPAWLIQGSQFFGGYSRKKQSFEGNYPQSFERFARAMRQANRPSLLVSGDVHYTEIMDIEANFFGYKTFEISSSSIHSFPKIGIEDNPRRRKLEGDHNHVIVDLKQATGGAHYEVKSLGKNAKVNFTDQLKV